MLPTELKLARVALTQTCAPLRDVEQSTRTSLAPLRGSIRPGMRVAVAVGSRGISNLALIVRTAVDFLRAQGAEPFIIPAMGSHGGGTAAGQEAVLAGYGITEQTAHAPVRATMEVVSLGFTEGTPRIPVFMDRFAFESDGVLVINRVKPHTDFHGEHESGIVKMLTIGLGKHRQALQMHSYGADGLRDYIPRVSRVVIESGKLLGALGILEDGCDNTSRVAFARPEEIFALDSELLAQARRSIARLPFDDLDLLIVDCMGKDYSGTGLDTNVIGRMRIRGSEDTVPHCRRVVTLDLSPASHGNALGVGLADVVTRRLVDKIDWRVTQENVVTSGFLERGFLPIVCETDQAAVGVGLRGLGRPVDPESVRAVRIRNTLALGEAWVSPALLRELPDVQAEASALTFDSAGNICMF